MAKQITRKKFLDELTGATQAAKTVLGREVRERAQFAAIHNQFLQVDLSMDECENIMNLGGEAILAMARLQDALDHFRANPRLVRDGDGWRADYDEAK